MITMITIKRKTIKIKDIMNTNTTNIENIINLSTIANKEFVLWLKQEIKSLVEDQKIAKRDRKDSKHPCPDKRKYDPYHAWARANSNGEKLRIYYVIYHVLRHHRDFKWEDITLKRSYGGWGTSGLSWINEFLQYAREIDSTFELIYETCRCLGNLAERFCARDVINGQSAEKTLCHN